MAAVADAVDSKDCTHGRTELVTSGTEEIEVCTQCGMAVPSKDSQFQNSYSQSSRSCPYSVDDMVSEKLKRFVAKDVRNACNEFRFEGQLVNNMTDFVHSFCKQSSAANYRPFEKHRRAVIVWYIYKESHRSSEHLTVKGICDRLQWPGISPSVVHQVEKKMRRDFPNLVDPFLRLSQEQDPSRELMRLVSSMTGAGMSEADKAEVVTFATRLFKCLSEAKSTFHHLKHQNTYRVAVARVTLEHFAAEWQAKGKTICWAPPKGHHAITRKLKEELVKLSRSIPYIAVSCDVAKVHRVLDTIVRHIECTEGDSDGAAGEAEFAPLDLKERQEAIKRVQQEMAEGSVTGSDGVSEGGAVPESSIKEEEAIRALLHRGLSADLILKWPTPLAELLEFSCAGDMKEGPEELGEQDLKEEEEEEYILTSQLVLERQMMWQKVVQQEESQPEKEVT